MVRVEQQRRALELRKFGLTFQQIAAELGVSQATAHGWIKSALADIPNESAMDLRAMQMERCQAWLVAIWPKCQAGDERSIETGLRIMDKMDRLMGTEAPQQQNVNITGAVLQVGMDSDQYIEGLRRMAGIVSDSEYERLKSGADVIAIDVVAIDTETAGQED